MNEDNPDGPLVKAVRVTEALAIAVRQDRVTVHQVQAALMTRQRLLSEHQPSDPPTARQRELARRLCALDADIVTWCDKKRKDLRSALRRVRRRSRELMPRNTIVIDAA